jgi:hypothetical protein
MKKAVGFILIMVMTTLIAHAGMDSAGVSTLGGQEQTDVQTHGGGVSTSGGGLDLSGGDVLDAGQVGAASVEATTIQGGNVMVTGTLSNPNSGAVTISDGVRVTGQTDAIQFKLGEIDTQHDADATSKHYVDSQIAKAQERIIEKVNSAGAASLFYCSVSVSPRADLYTGNKTPFYTTSSVTANSYNGKVEQRVERECSQYDDWGRCRRYQTYTIRANWACSSM